MTQTFQSSEPRRGASLSWRALRGLPWIAVLMISLAGAVVRDWQLASVAGACLGLALLPKAYTAASGVIFPSGSCTGVLIFTAAALLAGELGGLYRTSAWWDVALHVIAAAYLAVFGMALAMTSTGGARPPRIPLRILAVLAFGFAMMVGAMWELMEFSIDAAFGTHAQRSGLPDTMGDELSNMIGAIVGAYAAHARITRGMRGPMASLLGRFMAANPALYPNLTKGARGPKP